MKMSSKKATIIDDIPIKIIKELSVELADPLAHILSFGIRNGKYPNMEI